KTAGEAPPWGNAPGARLGKGRSITPACSPTTLCCSCSEAHHDASAATTHTGAHHRVAAPVPASTGLPASGGERR
ncbi:hypothetical protein P7K49_029327, partial [Saguinus oedipus]